MQDLKEHHPTDQRHELLENQERMRQIIACALDAIITMSETGLITGWNPQAESIFGWSKDEALGQRLSRLIIPPIHQEAHEEGLKRVRQTRQSHMLNQRVELTAIRKDGSEFPVELSMTSVQVDGHPQFCAFMRDLTERKEAESKLSQARQQTESLSSLTCTLAEAETPRRAALAILETARKLTGWDSSWLDLWNKTTHRFENLAAFDTVNGKTVECHISHCSLHASSGIVKQTMREGSQLVFRESSQTPSEDFQSFGSNQHSLSMMLVPIRQGSRPLGILSLQSYHQQAYDQEDLQLIENIANQCAGALARIQSASALAVQEERLQEVWENTADAMRITDASGKIIQVNEAFCRLVSKSRGEIEGQSLTSVYAESEQRGMLERYQRRFSKRELPTGIQLEIELWNQQKVHLELSNSLINADSETPLQLTVLRNVTERDQMQKMAHHAERLRSLGTLAGGIAHDLNNALAPITMALDVLRLEHPDDNELLDTIEKSANHGADMVRQLLTFSKGIEGERTVIQPRYLLKEMEQIIKGTFPKNIDLKVSIYPEDHQILGDDTQLHQVLLNLCVNARDAMPDGGTLHMESDFVQLGEDFVSANQDFKPGSYVVWRIRDTGTGIPEDVLNHIFDPFFTTKDQDKGTGLGLSILMGIVNSHEGYVRVESKIGKGTCFTVYLPEATLPEQTPTPPPKKAEPAPESGHGETILVVDDEESVRKVLRIVLQQMNFKVITACDGQDGLEKLQENMDDIRLVISDMHMPRLDGFSMVTQIRSMAPDLDIMVASGRVDSELEKKLHNLGIKEILGKPFPQKDLRAALGRLLQIP